MNIDQQARATATTERHHQQHRPATMESRSQATTAMPSRDGVDELAPAGITSEQQHDKSREANRQFRAYKGH